MTIVHLITSTDVGGAERVLARLVQCTDASRFQHAVISMAPVGDVGKELISAGVPVRSLAMSRGRVSPAAVFELRRLLMELKPDVLHCWMYHANLLGAAAAKIAETPHLLWGIRCSEMDFARYRPLTRWVVSAGALLSSLPDAIVVNSHSGAKLHIEMGYNRSKIITIYNGFDLERFQEDSETRCAVRRELGIADDAPLIGLIARYDPMKDHENFFNAAGILSRRRPETNFLLCGHGVASENAEIDAMVRKNGLEKKVRLLGLRNDVARLTAALDIATSSAYGEGFCNALGEAMSCAVPCVATDVGDTKWLVGETGSLVPPHDPQALAAAWAELIELAASQRHALGQTARERIREHFSLAVFRDRYESLYEGLRNGSPRAVCHFEKN